MLRNFIEKLGKWYELSIHKRATWLANKHLKWCSDIWFRFPSAWKTSCRISCNAVLLVIDPFTENVFIYSSFITLFQILNSSLKGFMYLLPQFKDVALLTTIVSYMRNKLILKSWFFGIQCVIFLMILFKICSLSVAFNS